MLVVNARMYSVEPVSTAAWHALLAWVATHAGVSVRPFELDPGEPLDVLWRRPDVAITLMCGYPWATWDAVAAGRGRPEPLAAPVPSSVGHAAYRTAIVVRADGDLDGIDALRGRRFAYTTPSSQSGYQAVRRWLAEPARAIGGRWFAAMAGPLLTPRRVVDAVLEGDADGGPLDSYWLDILARNEPATAARLRIVASTPLTPLPLLVCSAGVDADVRTRLAAGLRAAGRAPALAAARDALALADIGPVDPAAYAVLAARAREADAAGYAILQ